MAWYNAGMKESKRTVAYWNTMADAGHGLESLFRQDVPVWVASLDSARAADLVGLDPNRLSPTRHGLDTRPGLFPRSANDLLAADYERRAVLEGLVLSMTRLFRRTYAIPSFRLPMTLAHVSRTLSDEIDLLRSRGAVAHDPDDDSERWSPTPGYVPPRWTDYELTKPWARRQVADDIARTQGRDPMVVEHNLDTLMAGGMSLADAYDHEYRAAPVVRDVIGIDLETTGLRNTRAWVIDAGWMTMDMAGDEMPDGERRSYGVPDDRHALGNPTEFVSHIDLDDLRGLATLDEDADAQSELLTLLCSRPYVAHNARFEDSMFMTNVEGYAEARRDGRIVIIDTKKLSQRLDPREAEGNSLQSYARRWGALAEDESERHLGLDDTRVMLVAMRRHMASMGLTPVA